MKLPSTKSITFVAGLCACIAALTLTIALSGKHAHAAEPPPFEMKQPACTCTAAKISFGHVIENCQCGVMQCVVTHGSGETAAAMVCTK